jgi:hypothetical protein
VLSGDKTFVYSSCTNESPCTLDGLTLAHASSSLFYKASTVAFGKTCASVSLSRTCTNGKLSGNTDYKFSSCVVTAPTASVQQNLANTLSALESAIKTLLTLFP